MGYSLGLAASVLYLGALGDRYGRELMLVSGLALSVPACLLAAWAPSVGVLIVGRVLGGPSAGMAYPTTLALAGIIAIVLGIALVFFLFPGKDDEATLLASYAEQDIAPVSGAPGSGGGAPGCLGPRRGRRA